MAGSLTCWSSARARTTAGSRRAITVTTSSWAAGSSRTIPTTCGSASTFLALATGAQAVGRYQLRSRYFDVYKRQLSLGDFGPAAQTRLRSNRAWNVAQFLTSRRAGWQKQLRSASEDGRVCKAPVTASTNRDSKPSGRNTYYTARSTTGSDHERRSNYGSEGRRRSGTCARLSLKVHSEELVAARRLLSGKHGRRMSGKRRSGSAWYWAAHPHAGSGRLCGIRAGDRQQRDATNSRVDGRFPSPCHGEPRCRASTWGQTPSSLPARCGPS